MILCIEIGQETKDKLDQLLRLGQYVDYSQLIAVAIANQVLLHKKVSGQGRSILFANSPVAGAPCSARQSSVRVSGSTAGVPLVFSLPITKPLDGEPAPTPGDAFVPGASVPVDRWIFGQHNKLLPAKASCRALSTLCTDVRGIPLAKASSDIAAYAEELGDYLRAIDEKNSLNRDEALSVAFPVSGSDTSDKARLRYANQFVASINKQGQLSGLLVDLKLVNYVPGKESRLMLTQPGWDFAALENPILDRRAQGLPKFSEEEIAFLLDHIRRHVPAEDYAYRTVIRAVSEGANNPDMLDAYLQPLLSARAEKPFTRAFLATQRSGVISRMADLGLVERHRDGKRVTYIRTEKAIEYLKNSDAVAKIA